MRRLPSVARGFLLGSGLIALVAAGLLAVQNRQIITSTQNNRERIVRDLCRELNGTRAQSNRQNEILERLVAEGYRHAPKARRERALQTVRDLPFLALANCDREVDRVVRAGP